MSGRQTDASAVARALGVVNATGHLWRVGLKRGSSVRLAPLSSFTTPDPGLGAMRFVRGRVLLGQTFPFSSC
jgi:hypothetical protein